MGGGPSRDEVKQQEHLVGMMGKEMLGALQEAGIEREKLLIVHSYACMATEPKRDKEERAATNACRPLMRKLVEQLPRSTPTLLAGKWALLSLTGKQKGLFTTRGFVDMKWKVTDGAKEAEQKDEAEGGPEAEGLWDSE